jgi:hypothetical protein
MALFGFGRSIICLATSNSYSNKHLSSFRNVIVISRFYN